jgi:hypothetical protein
MNNVILELGKDFLFIGEEYKLQVDNSDFFIDLLFYHRGHQCLVAFELKADTFKPDSERLQIHSTRFYSITRIIRFDVAHWRCVENKKGQPIGLPFSYIISVLQMKNVV